MSSPGAGDDRDPGPGLARWSALAPPRFTWKVFVPPQPEPPPAPGPGSKATIHTSLSGDQAKTFYEELVGCGSEGEQHSAAITTSQGHMGHCGPQDTRVHSGAIGRRHVDDSTVKEAERAELVLQNVGRVMGLAQRNEARAVQQALDAGLSVDVQDQYGWTLLMVAACAGAGEVVQLLLGAGACTGVQDARGHTALSLATCNHHSRVVLMLTRATEGSRGPGETQANQEKQQDSPRGEYHCQPCGVRLPLSGRTQHQTSIVHQLHAGGPTPGPRYSLGANNRGYQLLVRQGWDQEGGLGPQQAGAKFPVKTVLKADRAGLGSSPGLRPRVTHFGPADPAAVAAPPSLTRVENRATLSRRQRRKQQQAEKRQEIAIRRQLS